MQPDIDLQLEVTLRALQNVVAPAIDSTDKPALEQLQLSIRCLTAAKSLLKPRHRLVRAELTDSVTMAMQVRDITQQSGEAIVDKLSQAISRCESALNDANCDTEALLLRSNEIRQTISEAVNTFQHTEHYEQITRYLVVASKQQIDKLRAWCFDCGLEDQTFATGILKSDF